MVERVARAICGGEADEPGPYRMDDGRKVEAGEVGWMAWQNEARAAIAAMREPTEEMKKAGAYAFVREWTDPFDCLSPEADRLFGIKTSITDEAWQPFTEWAADWHRAMIDEALK